MYMCICVYRCLYVCVYIYMCICGCVYVCAHTCIYIYSNVCVYMCMSVYIYICICVYMCMYVLIYVYMYIRSHRLSFLESNGTCHKHGACCIHHDSMWEFIVILYDAEFQLIPNSRFYILKYTIHGSIHGLEWLIMI